MRKSKIENKSAKRLKAIIRKYDYKIKRLQNIVKESREFNIPLSAVTFSAIIDKIDFYKKEQYQVSKVWNLKFKIK